MRKFRASCELNQSIFINEQKHAASESKFSLLEKKMVINYQTRETSEYSKFWPLKHSLTGTKKLQKYFIIHFKMLVEWDEQKMIAK